MAGGCTSSDLQSQKNYLLLRYQLFSPCSIILPFYKVSGTLNFIVSFLLFVGIIFGVWLTKQKNLEDLVSAKFRSFKVDYLLNPLSQLFSLSGNSFESDCFLLVFNYYYYYYYQLLSIYLKLNNYILHI